MGYIYADDYVLKCFPKFIRDIMQQFLPYDIIKAPSDILNTFIIQAGLLPTSA